MSHTIHPDSHIAGLADGCPRCAEHAEHPFESLDENNIRAIAARVVNDDPARSDTEAAAMRVVEATLLHTGKLALVAPEILERYLLQSWYLTATVNQTQRKDDSVTH